ncbi:MAG: SDR family oxidoreductase [Pseudomonadota bacterium]|nr:SDR family oxidoreductase [Pseudomonadota bacterium]
MRVVVTGGAGFIGSHVVDLCLAKGHEVTVLDNLTTGRVENFSHIKKQIEFVECDLGSAGSWHNHFKNKDWVIHLAALADIVPSIQNPQEYFSANVTGTFNVLQASIDHQVKRFVYSASSSCYGLATIFPTPEDAPIMPQYPYALTKRLGEELVLHWANIFDLPALSLRFFNVYGPRSRTSGTYGAVFGVFLAQKLANQPFTIVGDGKQTRDFTYVSDVADAVLAATESNVVGNIFNVGSGKSVSINRIVELLGGRATFIPKRPGEPECTFANIKKIQSVLGWSPKVPIEEGVRRLLSEIDYWKEAVVWTPDSIAEATKDWFEKLGKNDAN